jgi:2-oxoglutarate dehydrogenase E2 component (dihydrolipoamide succinyltransferase)
MKVEIKVPAVGESVSEAVVARIIKNSGSEVKKEDELIELETDKVNQVIYAPESGLLTLKVKVEDRVKIGDVIGFIDTDKVAPSKAEPQKEAKKAIKPPEKPSESAQGARHSQEAYLASVGQKLPSKAVFDPPQKASESKHLKTNELDKSSQKRVRLSGLRRTVAQRLVEVKNTTAMLTTFNEVDMSNVMKIRQDEKDEFEKRYGVRLGFLSFFITASSSALKAFPEVNAYLEGDEMVYNQHHHIGVAVSTDKGLFVPVIRTCETLSFADIEKSVVNFAKKAKEGAISIQDLQGGTFTITNGGVFGSLLSTPILNPPQSAILGMHKIMPRPVVVDNQIVIRPMMYLALSYDHRIIDGKEAVSFLVHIKECIENPTKLLLES